MKDYKKWIAGVFDRVASNYGCEPNEFFVYFGKKLCERALLKPGDSVLDIATGRGAVLVPAAKKVGPKGRAVGIDLSAAMVEETKKHLAKSSLSHIDLLQMDVEELQFEDESFDHLLCGFGLFFFPSLEKALSECLRVVKKDGSLAFSSIWEKKSPKLTGWLIDFCQNKGIREILPHSLESKSSLKDLLQGCGVRDVQIYEEEKAVLYATAEEWWNSLWTHAASGALEQFSPQELEELKKESFKKVQELCPSGKVEEVLSVSYAVGKK